MIGQRLRIYWMTLFLLVAATARGEIADCIDATCRIRRQGGTGTGCVIDKSPTHYFVLTNAHVAGERVGDAVQVEFWDRGYQSRPIPGNVVHAILQQNGMIDIAVVAVERQRLGGIEPPVIPLAPAGTTISEPHLVSVGCSQGSWPTCWKGHRLAASLFEGSVIQFVPAPADGRSGSALFDGAGKQIVGLVAWRDDSQGVGLAMTHEVIWDFLRGRAPTRLSKHTQSVVPVTDQEFGLRLGNAPQACPQCEGLRLWPFGDKQPAPPPLPPTNPQSPWPDLPATLGGSGGTAGSDYVLRSEFEAALRDIDRRLSAQSGQLDNVDDQVTQQSASLRDKLRQIVTSDTVQQEVQMLKEDFLRRLKESEESQSSVRERLKESLLGAVQDRIEQIKTELANQGGAGGTPLGGIFSLALATALPMLGLGGLQTWLVTRAISRLTNRFRGQENESLLVELRNLIARTRGNATDH